MGIDYTHPRRAPRRDNSTADAAPPAPPEAGVAGSNGQSAGGVDYTRRERATRSAVSQGQTSPDWSATTTRVAAESAGPPTLVTSARAVKAVRSEAAKYVAAVNIGMQRVVDAYVSEVPNLFDEMAMIQTGYERVSQAFRRRYANDVGYDGQVQAYHSADDYARDAEALRAALEGDRTPMFQKARMEQQNRHRDAARRMLASRAPLEQRLLVNAYEQMAKRAGVAAKRALAATPPPFGTTWWTPTAIPPVVGDLEVDPEADEVVSGAGPLLVRAGWASPSTFTLRLSEPLKPVGSSSPTFENFQLPDEAYRAAIPIVLDLDEVGGVNTNSAATVNAILLRLLALLPSGRVKAHLFDPVKLGDSPSFLFGLGDAAEQIIGTKVKSTERELQELLVEIEEHITFVTQKYLQGQFDTLTNYNTAAGEVAEPYRFLVLYDYPQGFIRPGSGPDHDLLAKLKKIIGAGPRCGVFTLIASPGLTMSSELDTSAALPRLVHDGVLPTAAVSQLALGGPRNSTAAMLKATVPSYESGPMAGVFRDRSKAKQPFVAGMEASWLYHEEPVPSAETVAALLAHVERGLHTAADVRISATQVARLARTKQERAVARGIQGGVDVPDPSQPDTWWRESSAEGIVAPFGRVGANDVGQLVFDSKTFSGALVGGRPGSGKSVLLHAVITALSVAYSPEELELYLVDFKEGVEFKVYASYGLPQARVVAVESEREFGLSVLRSINNEIGRRGALFRSMAGEEVNIGDYRRRTGERMPRILLLMDEFHVLFSRDDKIANEAAELLDRVVRQGRAFGVHTLLASQTIAGAAALGKHTLNQIPTRVSLQSSEADSRLLLGDDNPDARLLTRPGEGILNNAGGLKDANQRFQAAFTSPEERAELIAHLGRRAHEWGFGRRPVVFEGRASAAVADADQADFAALRTGSTSLGLPLGLPLTLDGPVRAELRREPGGNALLVLGEDAAYGALVAAITSLVASGVDVDVVDFGSLDAPWSHHLDELAGRGVTVGRRQKIATLLPEYGELVRQRHAMSDYRANAKVLVLAALHRAREFDVEDSSDLQDTLDAVLRDGPDVGVHVVAWLDKPVSVTRRLNRTALREFAIRVTGPMSKEDSFTLLDSDAAAAIGDHQAVLDDHDHAVTSKFRPFGLPARDWIATVLEHGRR